MNNHFNILYFGLGLMLAAPAFADQVIVVPANDTAIRLTINCNGSSYNTSGARSDMNGLLDRADAFCRDQNKNAFDDSNSPGKQKNCHDYTIKNLADENQPERPGSACQQPDGSWQIMK